MDNDGKGKNWRIPDTSTTLMEALSRAGGAPDEAWARFARLYDPVVRWFLAMIRRSWTSLPKAWDDDIVQQTFLTLVETFPERRWDPSRGSFRDFLFGVVRIKALQYARSERGKPLTYIDPDSVESLINSAAVSEAEDKECAAVSAELWRSLVDSVFAESRMSEKSKAVFVKLVVDGVPVGQLCKEYGMTAASIYTLKSRVQDKIREKWLRVAQDGDLYTALENLARDLLRTKTAGG